MKITLCTCQFYRRTPREKIAAVLAACRAADMSCEIVPDLCYVAAKDRDTLERIAACDVVLACQTRAVRAMLGDAGHARCIDLRTESLADIFAALKMSVECGVWSVELDDELSDRSTGNSKLQIPNSKRSETPRSTLQTPHSDWTPWFPVIDTERCTRCRKCVDFCMFGVFAVDQNKVCVIKPESCKTDCPACARVCPQNAIMFPKSNEDRLNGSLAEPVKPSADDKISFRERLEHRKSLRLFKEDEP